MLMADKCCEMRNRKVFIGFNKLEIIGDLSVFFLFFLLRGGVFGGVSEIDVE